MPLASRLEYSRRLSMELRHGTQLCYANQAYVAEPMPVSLGTLTFDNDLLAKQLRGDMKDDWFAAAAIARYLNQHHQGPIETLKTIISEMRPSRITKEAP